ncbi:MAG: alpha-hydroxy-acid oxidizing protein [Lachnospiraceae bacterium]|nr:alpha-hydroxy-acid oxidizing protein [Lachnospiraceae bacterium]
MEYDRISDANLITARYMDSLLIEERLIDSVVADTSTEIFGMRFSSPVMTPAFSHLGRYKNRELTGLEEYSIAAKKCNLLNFCGMMENDMFQRIADTGAKTVRIIKPYADSGKIRDQIEFAKEVGAVGIGMDVDHIFGPEGFDVVVGEAMTMQTMESLHSYAEDYGLPFTVKGVLSVRDALKCAKLGAKAIIVSHHHGRMPYAVPPMMILPQIKEALIGKDVKIIVDCGISSGADVFKALALGADAAAVGRAMLPALEEDGVEGAKDFLTRVNRELWFIMCNTGFAGVSEIESSVLHRLQ